MAKNALYSEMQKEVEEKSGEGFIGEMKECEAEGVYVIRRGKCAIRCPKDGCVMGSIMEGDVFGEGELLHVRGFDYFGDIVVQSGSAEIWFISKKVLGEIPRYDLVKIRENLVKNTLRLCQLIIRYKDKSFKRI
eukprot:TRINITY_DN5589_c0_g1_i3.p1 TRINITY_DN5589_c0_g1~~TRINITY_DN5589_c0_g1_i3.p1  ORF type:complete len:134 (-),score=36.19 TRINITY_DN5589_c0_g1_i3:147-548(-)